MTQDTEPRFERIAQVRTGMWDGDSFGNEWQIHYTAYETNGELPYQVAYEVYRDDGKGNGDLFATLYRKQDALELVYAMRRANPE